MSDKKDYHCSFCGKHKNEINTLIAGPATYICNECIDLCHSIVHERKSVDNKTTEVNSDIPTPEDINEFLNAHVIGQDEAKEVLLFHNSIFSSSYIVDGFVKSSSKLTKSES